MHTLAPLRVRPFGRLLASYTVNELGDLFGAIALAVLVYDQTGDAVATAALFIAAKFLPAFAAPALTARLDQLAMRGVLVGLYVAEALVFGALALLAEDFLLPAVLVLALFDGTLALTARGLTRGVVAATLGTGDELRAGNGLMNMGFAVASVGGAALGGLVVAETGVQVALALDAASFAVVAAMIATCRTLPGAAETREPFRSRVREGLAHVRGDRLLRVLLAGQALALVAFTLAVPIEVIYAKETLDAGDLGFGLLMAAWGLGIVIGSAVFLVVRRLAPLVVVLASTAAVGVGYLGMSAVRELALACAFSVIGGLGNGVQWVSVMTLTQETTPGPLQARVAGLLESLGAAMPGIGFLLGGVLTSLLDPPTTYALAGAVIMALVAAGTIMAAVAARRGRPIGLRGRPAHDSQRG